MRRTHPILTLTTDFGADDSYVAEMKAVLLRYAPGASLVDVSHGIGPHDILGGSVVLERAVRAFGKGTIHLAVVDPGVGTDRGLLLIRVSGQIVICPDNGLITWTWRNHPGAKSFELMRPPQRSSATFHGRDIMAPIAGRIAAGEDWKTFCRKIERPILLDVAPAQSLKDACIIQIDHFGNAMTNVPAHLLSVGAAYTIAIGRHRFAVRQTYSDVAIGKPVAVIGSSDFLEIAVRNGSAARRFKLQVSQRVIIL